MYSFLPINFPRYLIKLGHFISAADSEKTMLIYLGDVPWLISLFSMLQNMLEHCGLFQKYSSLHLIQLSCCIHYHLIINLQLFFLPFVLLCLTANETFCSICCTCTHFDFQNIFRILSATCVSAAHNSHLNISFVYIFHNLSLLDGLIFPQKFVGKERCSAKGSMNTEIVPSPEANLHVEDVLSNIVSLFAADALLLSASK